VKVRIAFTVDVGPNRRRLIAKHLGQTGLASAADVRTFYRMHGTDGQILLHDLAAEAAEASGGQS
jgi:hypothetical protein